MYVPLFLFQTGWDSFFDDALPVPPVPFVFDVCSPPLDRTSFSLDTVTGRTVADDNPGLPVVPTKKLTTLS